MRKAADVSPENLIEIYMQKREKFDYFDRYQLRDIDKIGSDLKVNVDFENAEIEPYTDIDSDILGVRRIYIGYDRDKGSQYLSCIGMYAGGDWEYPVSFFVYLDQDGKTLRCYVPKEGNVWNWDKHMAFGNDEEKDKEFLIKWSKKYNPSLTQEIQEADEDLVVENYAELMHNTNLMKRDIGKRISI